MLTANSERLAELRKRLASLSWFMRLSTMTLALGQGARLTLEVTPPRHLDAANRHPLASNAGEYTTVDTRHVASNPLERPRERMRWSTVPIDQILGVRSPNILGVSCICLVFVGSVEMSDRERARVRAQRDLGSD